ncbi:hypothetical protein L6Q21_01755 [Sandaracinobacter sp. RS1-74]|uniref:hypothetical protein n=1 Tax=Sandaracinobacteroides sayramensis TaxID=2913411 RepID=UPI001EDABBAB|nr:hypothetical protein [Sandaracinobacteroides sayramensis]MCG2839705.1 hypothetical protein [Sandaracinobacteroides sayramensis]
MLAAAPAHAERPEDKAWLKAGVFRASVDTSLKIDDSKLGIPGTRIDFEEDLGFRRHAWKPKVEGGVRFGKAFRVEADYFSLGRSGGAAIDAEIRIDDTVFPVDAELDASFRTDVWRIAAGWSPLHSQKGELGLSAGVHLTRARYSFSAEVAGVELSEAKSKTVPLPNVSLFGNYSIDGTWGLNGRVDLLSMKMGGYKGKLVDAQATVSARIHRHFGAGLGYRYVDYDLRVRKSDLRAEVDYRYHGPFAFAELAF